MIEIYNLLHREDTALGIISAEPVDVSLYPDEFEERINSVVQQRSDALSAGDEKIRNAARDILRNGKYRPTGRGKPASEYLLRSAQTGEGGGFPRINGPVDVCNFISLKYLLPVSLWDLDLAQSSRFVFRLGKEEEAYVFNTGGQKIALQDLIVGCRLSDDDGDGEPVVNPVKDSLFTKTTSETQRIAACIYTPRTVISDELLGAICKDFAGLLKDCGKAVVSSYAIVASGEHKQV